MIVNQTMARRTWPGEDPLGKRLRFDDEQSYRDWIARLESFGTYMDQTIALLRHGDPFGASVGLWWLGQSLMDLAPYINDARALALPLLGGGTGADRPGFHDWENILGYLGLLEWDHGIAWFTDTLGESLMLLSLVWAGWLLWRGGVDHRLLQFEIGEAGIGEARLGAEPGAVQRLAHRARGASRTRGREAQHGAESAACSHGQQRVPRDIHRFCPNSVSIS